MHDDPMSAAGAVIPPRSAIAPAASPERWRPIRGHRGYEASTEGRVRSARGVLSPQPDRDGYLRVKIRGRRYGLHVLVQLAYAGPPEVRHLDGDKSNNRPGNLAYGSRVENEKDKKKGKEGKERGIWERPSPGTAPARTPGTGGLP